MNENKQDSGADAPKLYKFVNVKKNFPSWRYNEKDGVYRYDPIFEIASRESLAYWTRNLQPEAIVRVE